MPGHFQPALRLADHDDIRMGFYVIAQRVRLAGLEIQTDEQFSAMNHTTNTTECSSQKSEDIGKLESISQQTYRPNLPDLYYKQNQF